MHINRLFFVIIAAAVLCQSCGNTRYSYKDIDKRKVLVKTDDDVIEAAVYDGFEVKKILPDRNYYWFDHSMIMSTRGGFTGELLHGEFLVQYRNYQIKEQGNFKFGLKHGTWKSWYENGLPKNFVVYKKGLLHGSYTEFDIKGKKTEEGKYSNSVKTGIVKQYDTDGKQEKKLYKEGKEVIKKEKVAKQKANTEKESKKETDKKPTSKQEATKPKTADNPKINLPASNKVKVKEEPKTEKNKKKTK